MLSNFKNGESEPFLADNLGLKQEWKEPKSIQTPMASNKVHRAPNWILNWQTVNQKHLVHVPEINEEIEQRQEQNWRIVCFKRP